MSADDKLAGDVQAAVDAGLQIAAPQRIDPREVYDRVVPAGASRETMDLERFLPRPRRTRGQVQLATVDDFARYVARHDDPASTTIWVDTSGQVVAVLDDHTQEGPQWGEHRANLLLTRTPEWEHWLRHDGQLLSQEAFAEHIEDGLAEIVTPDGATMLEVAQSIQGTRTAEFQGAHRLANGTVGFAWVEEEKARAGQKGDLEIPERFELAIAPFLGEGAYKVRARLRYRVGGGNVKLGYRLDRPHAVLRDAVDQIADRLTHRFQGDRVFVGRPR
jgi:uncharacterized protein YfdQ (DUF2303 family)